MKCPRCGEFLNNAELRMRSLPQQKYYFGVIVKILSDELGYTPNETHEVLKTLFLSELKILNTKNGIKEVRISRSTTEINTIEAEDYYSQIRQWASIEMGIFLPE